MRVRLLLVAVAGAFTGVSAAPASPAARVSCADFPDQAAAQRAANTQDANHNGIYCEDLPCPCLKPKHPKVTCDRLDGVQRLEFSEAEYPNIHRPFSACAPARLAEGAGGRPSRRGRAPRAAAGWRPDAHG